VPQRYNWRMPPSRYIRLTEEEDARRRRIEQDPYLKPKVRPRAQVLRLSHRGSNVRTIASYTGRSEARASDATSTAGRSEVSRGWPTVRLRATRRASPRRRGPSCQRGSPRRSAPGTPRNWPSRWRRAWGWALRPRPFVGTSSSRWDARGSAPATCPINRPIPSRSERPKRSWRTSKRGARRRDRPEVPRRKRLLFVSAPDVHLDEEGYRTPTSGEQPVGVRGTDQPHRHAAFGGGGRAAVGVLGDRGFVPQRGGRGLPGRPGGGGGARGQALRGVVLDNAPFHTSGAIRERESGWAARGLALYRLPAYCART
jgi:hypothetical protein